MTAGKEGAPATINIPSKTTHSVTTVNTVIFNDAGQLCDNDQSSLLASALKAYPTLIEIVDVNQRTLVHRAAEAGSWGCVEVLARAGAPVDQPDASGETPLHRALARRRMDASRILLDLGANPNAKNAYGASPTLYAAEASPDALALLVSRGGDASAIDNSGNDAAYWRARGERLEAQMAQTSRMKP